MSRKRTSGCEISVMRYGRQQCIIVAVEGLEEGDGEAVREK